jgi:thymidylate synthase (FAD)
MNPKVTLINPPSRVLETIWVLWECSKVDGPVELDVATVAATVPQKELEDLFWKVLAQHIPIAEHIHFTFMLEGVSVSLREQMVRHRIGTHVGDNFGVDIVPDLASSSWWSQSMRIQDMGQFADKTMYRVPDTLGDSDGPGTARGLFHQTMKTVQDAYSTLVMLGVPMEDARELIPLGAQHRISWALSLQSLLHILGKRGCWILQLGIWGPIIHGMVAELAAKIHPMFARIVRPPCIDQDDSFKGCQYRLENARRLPNIDGIVLDQHPPCPLWLCRDEDGRAKLAEELDVTDDIVARELNRQGSSAKDVLISADSLVPRHREMQNRAEEYRQLWHHDPYDWTKE